jgi:gliding motility-associated-like protein
LVEAIKDQFIVAPNAFSPNGDGQNDFFTITLRNILKFDIMIYDRWGNLLYQSQDPGFKWDGTVNNIPLPEGVYVYVITALSTLDDNMELNGSITLVR